MQLPDIQTNWITKIRSLLLSKKVIISVVAIALVVELVWAWKTLTSNKATVPQVINTQNRQIEAPSPKAELSLQTPKTNLKVGEKITVNINLASTKSTDGTDIILIYDPRILSVIKNKSDNSVVKAGALYTDYPVNNVNEQTGRIMVSGITTKQGGVLARGLFGTVDFQAKAPGRTKVVFDFTKGSTIDSNVIENKTSQEILDQVNNLEFIITP